MASDLSPGAQSVIIDQLLVDMKGRTRHSVTNLVRLMDFRECETEPQTTNQRMSARRSGSLAFLMRW